MFLWKIPDDYPERLLGSFDTASSPDRFSFKQGREVLKLIPGTNARSA